MPSISYYIHERALLEAYVERLPAGTFDLAACRGFDPDRYHPDVGRPTEDALRRCESCPTRVACVALTVRAEDPTLRAGWYGGLGPSERTELAVVIGLERPISSTQDGAAGPDRAGRASHLRDAGWTVNDIAVELGCSRRTVQRYLNDAA